MNWYKRAKDEGDFDIDEMKDWFTRRTNKHIDSVRKFCRKLIDYDKDRFGDLADRMDDHDKSKFKEPELEPYVYTTWQYKCKDDGKDFDVPQEILDKMQEATVHHIISNRHHPEFHCGRTTGLINEKDRDKPPEEIVDATKMTDLDIAEMVADWCAVSLERDNHPKDWADKNVNVRWKFADDQKDLIYELIGEIF